MPVDITSSLNISMLAQPSYLETSSFLVNMVGSHSGASGLWKNLFLSLIGNPPTGNPTSTLPIFMDGATSGSVSSVLYLQTGATNPISTNLINFSLVCAVDNVMGNCFVLEQDFDIEIDIEGTTSCIATEQKAGNYFDMSLFNDGVTQLTNSLNLVMAFTPTNVLNITMRCSGTQIVDTTDVIDNNGNEYFLQDDDDFLAVPDPVIVTLKGGAILTSVVNISMPVSHALKTGIVNMSSRGF